MAHPLDAFGSLRGSFCCALLFAAAAAAQQVPTTLDDFFMPGTQPETLNTEILSFSNCASCHGNYDLVHEPLRNWAASMMGQSMRDPLFRAAFTIAEQDVAFAGDLCLRCHTPGGWLAGRSEPTDGSALIDQDFEGVNCNMCHRMVDPVYKDGVSPLVDLDILADLPDHPVNPHSGQYVMDPEDRRRGPFDLVRFNKHDWLYSPFHSSSEMCATCHDVSNPVFVRQPDGTYLPGDLDAPHPTHDKYDQFPVERTYSEWLASEFADGPVEMGGRFGGNLTAVSSCQDCHMPDSTGRGCKTGEDRADLPTHQLNGGATWILQAVDDLYPQSDTQLTDESITAALLRSESLLRAASDLELTTEPGRLFVRIINQTGHKLPTGYPEGRRMWINVRFFDSQGALIAERGHYDDATAELTTEDTKVYETKIGVDQTMAALTGLPVGPTFHFAVNNLRYLDNRIPPRGFTNAGFEAVQADPVGYSYADGEYWDDTEYDVPLGAAEAEVRVFYQTASKEYIEFLRDNNHTNDDGLMLHAVWESNGKGPPTQMDFATIAVQGDDCLADFNGDGSTNTLDVLAFLNAWAAGDSSADINSDGAVNTLDVLAFLNLWVAGC